ncbi:MAG: FHIPEP family type III secretion protein [Candidatus Gastranaerophilales bacterium]
MFSKKVQYVIKTCSGDDMQELQNLLNEMSMNGWELYSMQENETDDGITCNCIFMKEVSSFEEDINDDIINVSTFKRKMEKMLAPQLSPYENCLEIQKKINNQKNKIAKIKSELELEPPASVGRKKLNDKISAGLKALDDLKNEFVKATSPDIMYSKLTEDKIAICLSEEILGLVDSEQEVVEEELVAETVKTRLKLTEELGYVIPKIMFRDAENLNPFEFSIRMHGLDVFKAAVYPNYLMFFVDDLNLDKELSNTIVDVDKISGKDIVWVEKEIAKDFWHEGISSSAYIAKALEHNAIKYVDDLLDYKELNKYIEVVNGHNPFLVENIIPDFLSLSDLRFVLVSLIRERISIKDISFIFEKINDFAQDCCKADLIKRVRLLLSRYICSMNVNDDGIILGFEISEATLETLEPDFEEEIDEVVRIDADFAEKLAEKIVKKADEMGIESPKIFVPMEMRHMIFSLLSNYLNDFTVLSREEIGCNATIEIIGEI